MSAVLSPLQGIRQVYTEHLGLSPADLWAVDFTLAIILASKLPRDEEALFGGIIAPPATGKTETLRPYFRWDGVTLNYSEGTDNAWLSGSPTTERSLFHRLDRRTLLVKDMTPLMTKDGRKWDQFFGVIREGFDGSYDKYSGALDASKHPVMRFNIIAAATDEVYQYMDRDQDMGQRFLFIRMFRESNRAYRRAIFDRVLDGERNPRWRTAIKDGVRGHVRNLIALHAGSLPAAESHALEGEDNDSYRLRLRHQAEEQNDGWSRLVLPDVDIPSDLRGPLFSLCNVVTRVRSAKTDSVKGAQSEEGIPRYAKQLRCLLRMRSVADARTTIGAEDYEFARVVSRDTITPNRFALVRALYEANAGADPSELSSKTCLALPAVSNLLNHWVVNGFVTTTTTASGRRYVLSEEAREDLAECRILDSA